KYFIRTALSLDHKQAIEVLTECVPQSGLRNIQTFWDNEQSASRDRTTNLASEHTAEPPLFAPTKLNELVPPVNADVNPVPHQFVAVKPKPEDCAAPSPVQTAEPVPRGAMTMEELIKTYAALKSIRDDLRSRRLPCDTVYREYQRAQQLRSEFESRNGVHRGIGSQIEISSYILRQETRAQQINDLILQINDIYTKLEAERPDARPATPPYTGKISHRRIIDFGRVRKSIPWMFPSENSSCTNGEPPAKSRRIDARSSSSPSRSCETLSKSSSTLQPESLNNMELKRFDKPSESSSVQSCETLSKSSSTLQPKSLNNMELKRFDKPSESSSVQSCETLSKSSSTLQPKSLNNMELKRFDEPSKC
ncbi:MAG: hypothetical protein ACI4PJ_00735, partial [Acutalibacteraceae bacterium]